MRKTRPISERVEPSLYDLIEQHAADSDRSVSEEVAAALRVHALALVLGSLHAAGIERALGEEHAAALRSQVACDLRAAVAIALPHQARAGGIGLTNLNGSA